MEFKSRSVNIFGTKFKIKFVDSIKEEEGCYPLGLTNYDKSEILIRVLTVEGNPLSPEEIAITLYHELFHAILRCGQYNSLSDDEPLVEWLARCLASLLKQKVL